MAGTKCPFVIHDHAALAMSLDFSIMLPPGGRAVIPVRVELDDVVEAVDFDQVPVHDGQHLVEDGPVLSEVREELRGAFGGHRAREPALPLHSAGAVR